MVCGLAPRHLMAGCAAIRSPVGKRLTPVSGKGRMDVQAKRHRWRKRQDWPKQHLHLPGRIVFPDGTGLNTGMAGPRGRSGKGLRPVASIPHGHWKTMTFTGGLRHNGMTAPRVPDGPMDGPAFITCIKTRSAPTLDEGDVVVPDNLPAHRVAAALAAIRERGAWLLFLPPCSPDLNPTGPAFPQPKARMKRLASENRRGSVERCRRNPRTVLKTRMRQSLLRNGIMAQIKAEML